LLLLLLLLLLAFLHPPLLVLLFPLLFLFVIRNTLLDIGLQAAALEDWQLGQLKCHLVIVVLVGELCNDLDDTLRLGLRQEPNLLDQAVALIDCEGLLVQIFDRLALRHAGIDRWSTSGWLTTTLRGCLDRLLARRLLRVSLLLRLLKAFFQLLDPTLLLFELVAVVAISRWNCRIQLAHLTEN